MAGLQIPFGASRRIHKTSAIEWPMPFDFQSPPPFR
jgi:hypothetical protein